MTTYKVALILTFCISISSLGCTHRQLRYDHVMQARGVTTIFEQQVLDNLAMFSQSHESLPFFAIPSGGIARVTDSETLVASTLNGPARTVLGPLTARRDNQESWTLTPIVEPARLKLMKEAYQAAVNGGVEFTSSDRRSPLSECRLQGHYCGCSIEICAESRAAFTQLVEEILNAAVGKIAAPAEKTMEVQEAIYDEKGRIKEIRRYTRKAEEKLVRTTRKEIRTIDGNASAVEVPTTKVEIQPGELIPDTDRSRSTTENRIDAINNELQLQLFREGALGF